MAGSQLLLEHIRVELFARQSHIGFAQPSQMFQLFLDYHKNKMKLTNPYLILIFDNIPRISYQNSHHSMNTFTVDSYSHNDFPGSHAFPSISDLFLTKENKMGSFGVKPWAIIDKSINGGKIRDEQYNLEGKLKRRCVLRGKKIIGVDSVFGPIFCSHACHLYYYE